MAFWKIDGVEIPCPSSFTWGLQDVSDPDAGRTLDATMHKNRVGQKRKLSIGYNNPDAVTASVVLKAINPEYIEVYYPDAMSGDMESRTFYVGDRTAPMKYWYVGNHKYSSLTFELIER